MRLYLINPSNPLVSIVNVNESRWNRYRVWKPLSLMVLAGRTPPDWEIIIVDENLGQSDYSAMPRPDLVGITAFYFTGEPRLSGGRSLPLSRGARGHGRHSRHPLPGRGHRTCGLDRYG